jgi:hypothetical protein
MADSATNTDFGPKLWLFFESPLFLGFVSLVLLAIGSFVGEDKILFLLAWICGTVAVYRAEFFQRSVVSNVVVSLILAGSLLVWCPANNVTNSERS